MKSEYVYKLNEPLTIETARRFYCQSTLAGKRPVEMSDSMLQMLNCANLIITAWDGDKLIGLSRAMTDFCYVAYLADLAVHKDYRNTDIEKRLIIETQLQLAPYCTIVIVARPDEAHYFNGIGFTEHKPTYVAKALNFLFL